MLVIVVTVLVSLVVTGPLEVKAVAKDAVACALYVGNYRFAFGATNYLSAQGPVSPLQNYWSLGVEEQFYLVWPLLMLGAYAHRAPVRGPRRRPAPAAGDRVSRGPVLVALAVIAVLSFWLCVYLTKANQPWAFFSLPTRAWELAVGGFLALAVRDGRRLAPWVAATLGWAGLAAVGFSLFAFGADTRFPGPAALIPVLGTGAALVAGTRASRFGPSGPLGVAPMRAIGTVSYTWYLWHWPALILAPYVVGHTLDVAQEVGVGLASLVLAVLTTALVEQPLRRLDVALGAQDAQPPGRRGAQPRRRRAGARGHRRGAAAGGHRARHAGAPVGGARPAGPHGADHAERVGRGRHRGVGRLGQGRPRRVPWRWRR